MLTPTQIQRMCGNYHVADYEVSLITPNIARGAQIDTPEPYISRDSPRRSIQSRPQWSQWSFTSGSGIRRSRTVWIASSPRSLWARNICSGIFECSSFTKTSCISSIGLTIWLLHYTLTLHMFIYQCSIYIHLFVERRTLGQSREDSTVKGFVLQFSKKKAKFTPNDWYARGHSTRRVNAHVLFFWSGKAIRKSEIQLICLIVSQVPYSSLYSTLSSDFRDKRKKKEI